MGSSANNKFLPFQTGIEQVIRNVKGSEIINSILSIGEMLTVSENTYILSDIKLSAIISDIELCLLLTKGNFSSSLQDFKYWALILFLTVCLLMYNKYSFMYLKVM